jgi:hypothetical protein
MGALKDALAAGAQDDPAARPEDQLLAARAPWQALAAGLERLKNG